MNSTAFRISVCCRQYSTRSPRGQSSKLIASVSNTAAFLLQGPPPEPFRWNPDPLATDPTLQNHAATFQPATVPHPLPDKKDNLPAPRSRTPKAGPGARWGPGPGAEAGRRTEGEGGSGVLGTRTEEEEGEG